MKRIPILVFPALLLAFLLSACGVQPKLLVFSKTAGYRHASIETGIEAIRALGAEHGFLVEATEDSTAFNDAGLSEFSAVLFLSTTLDVLGEPGQQAFQRYIEAGGGYVGIHAASDTEYDWPWYGQLVGGYFRSHPAIQEAHLHVLDSEHISTAHLPEDWVRTDEWYEINRVNEAVNLLLEIDETTYDRNEPPSPGDRRPMAWFHEFDGGRSWYTALGHTDESYSEPEFLGHILGGIQWAMGGADLDYSAANVRPADDRFARTVLDQNLNEPMELDVLPDGRVLFIERNGSVFLHDPAARATTFLDSVDVFYGLEDGLLGIAVDPNWEENQAVWMYYAAPGDEAVQHLSRFFFDGSRLDKSSEVVVLKVATQRDECCHAGGSVQFGPDGSLYVSTGDNTNPFASQGYTPIDEQPGRAPWDAQRTAANTQDLRGKILRIMPQADGTYTIPSDNLFAGDPDAGRPEIYVMGDRNPFRIHVDQRNGWLYWGEIGPDATEASPERGPEGFDEINQARAAGFFGWPYFIADNRPYRDWDFASGAAGPAYDPAAPINRSPNNTGAIELPRAQGAFLWYPYGASDTYPLFGEGGRSAMAGPVYYHDDYAAGPSRFPSYYDGKLFVHEWMRHRIYAVSMDETGAYRWMESFLPDMPLSRPMDMEFGPDGSLYMIEYGEVWNARNLDARLVRITYRA